MFNTGGGYNPVDKDGCLFIEFADIRYSIIKLDKGIHVGITKEQFYKGIETSTARPDCNHYFMTDFEWQCYHHFYFENDRLVRITLDYMD